MPRHAAKHDSAVYSSQYSSTQYLSDSSQSTAHSPQSPTAQTSLAQPSQSASKKKHVCATCERGFTTSGHLARHLRVHTGERNHKCPFPGCETRCSRQDNLQQHYRIHLSPGSRRSSTSATRAALARATGSAQRNARSVAIMSHERTPSDPPSPPPALERAVIPPPPDSPPPLVQAYSVPVYPDSIHSGSVSSRSPTPRENTYPMISQHPQALTNGHVTSQHSPLQSHYSDSPPNYGEPSQPSSYGYATSTSHSSSASTMQDHTYDYSYTDKSPLPRVQSSLHQSSMDSLHDASPPSSAHLPSVPSRLSISHISHPQSYPNHYHNVSANTPSPDSTHSVSPHSQASGPPTPNYHPVYRDDGHDGSSYQTMGSVSDHTGLTNGYMSSQSHLVHNTYNHPIIQQQSLPRYDSPPPILAPIQDERVIRGDVRASHVQHSSISSTIPPIPLPSSYMHSSMHSYPYHAPPMVLNQAGWKPDSLLRGRSSTSLV
ncbi:hypothetical protein F5I97DRAFT_1858851 [Phlebopus sp. FC_14]|nr:hypothetical protein F5I97DRAFT_1858851 [Phlebopus sp. FC_14]